VEPEFTFERFIDGCSCRNEPLARLMRRFGLCEEKGSGVDKIIRAIEERNLPALEYRVDSVRTTCILRGRRAFVQMTHKDRIRACYQHCWVRYLSEQPITNQSLRERFGLDERQHGSVSNVIAATLATGQIKMDSATAHSKRYARYLPFWA
jgi:ATP-dependent DNA helicase RecG